MGNATLDNRHSLALPYWARPGVAMFARPNGAEGGDDEGDDEDDEDDDDGEDDDPDADKTPEELKAELVAARSALKKANGESERGRKNLKGRVTALEAELEEARKGGGDAAKGKVDEQALDKAVVKAKREGFTEGVSAGTKRVMSAEAKSALVAKGAPAAKVSKLIGLIDFSELELDDEGVLGLDDAVDELVADWPELFNTKRMPRIGGKGGRGDNSREDSKRPMTATERQVAELAKGRR